MKNISNKSGLTLVEIIVTIAVLGIVICPLMSMFITSEKINRESDKEYKSIQQAQRYMEEIKSMSEIDTEKYSYNCEIGIYEMIVIQTNNNYGASIKIKPDRGSVLYSIEIIIRDGEEIINNLEGTKIFN